MGRLVVMLLLAECPTGPKKGKSKGTDRSPATTYLSHLQVVVGNPRVPVIDN